MTFPGGLVVELRERGLRGEGRRVGGALAYPRTGGSSYWTATSEGFEEWILVEQAKAAPVAEWEVRGATPKQEGDAVFLADRAGTVRVRVTAPRAYAAGGAEARAWLRAKGQVIALYTDARGGALVDPGWTTVGSMVAERVSHTATLLLSGKVLLAGGYNGCSDCLGVELASAELYDPGAGTFSATGSLSAARAGHTATLLPSGKVLVAGGFITGSRLVGAELYDPGAGTFSVTGSLATARCFHTATLLPSGKVLVVGGSGGGGTLASAEVYDPGAGTFGPTGSLATARTSHTATLLPSGKVLVAGGENDSASFFASAELYDPGAGTFSATGSLASARSSHTATLLASGKVLVAGGENGSSLLPGAELYDPVAGAFGPTGALVTARYAHTATLLPSGRVLVAGGEGGGSSAEVYDPGAGTWSATAPLAAGRAYHTATLLPSGRVLVAGGSGGSGSLASAEVYDPGGGSFGPTGSLATARSSHTATLLPSGKVLVAGGTGGSGYLASAELYDPSAGSFSPTGSLAAARTYHTATLLASGKVLVAGGFSNVVGYLASAEVYDPAAGSFSPTGSLATARQYHTATLLASGKVLVAGGTGGGVYLASAELYDPAAETWSATGSLGTGRYSHTATLLPAGKVLVAGGYNGSMGSVASAEVYDPAAGTWNATGSLATARQNHTATLLASGKVLAAGGNDNGASLPSAEVYDPVAETWNATGSLAAARQNHTATLLPSGKVLAAGGSATAELYDEGRGAQATWTPALSTAPASAILGSSLSLAGTLFTGVSEGSGGGTQSSPANYPLVEIERQDSEATAVLPASAFTATSATASLPSTLQEGWFWLRVVVNGVPSAAQPVLVVPAVIISPASASVPPKGSATFTASGGIGTGFTWSLATNASGGSIDASTGAYTAGATGSVADVVKVTDSLGNAGTTSVTVTAGVTVSPAVQTVTTGATTSFKASGGSGTGFTFSLAMNASRGSIDAVNGNYRAGTQTGTDVVEATDSLGNVGTAQVTVVAAPSGGGCGYDGGGGLWLSLLALAAVRWLRALSRTKDHATA